MRRVVARASVRRPRPVAPPEGLKTRVLANAMAQEQQGTAGGGASPGFSPCVHEADARHTSGTSRSPPPAAMERACSGRVARARYGAGMFARSLRTQVQSLRRRSPKRRRRFPLLTDLATARRDAATLKTTIRVLSAPDMIQVNLKEQRRRPTPSRAASGAVARSDFQADGLPGSTFKVYQLWVIKDGKPGSLGHPEWTRAAPARSWSTRPGPGTPADSRRLARTRRRRARTGKDGCYWTSQK